MNEFLKNLIAKKEARAKEIKKIIAESQDINQVRSLGDELETTNTEIAEARSELAALEPEAQTRNDQNANQFNPVAMYAGQNPAEQQRSVEDPLATMEYRTAFKNYVQRGVLSPVLQRREATENVTGDLGVLLPKTIIQEIMKGVEKVYGQLYSRVKKTNLKGAVQYPIGSFSATLVWSGTAGTDTENGVSEKKKAGSVTSYVEFTYFIGEIRIAQSLLESVVTVDAFEQEIVKAIVEGYVKGMDVAILSGTGSGQPTGILTNVAAGLQRIANDHIISFTAEEMADWTKWQEKLFAKIPLSMRKERPMFHMTANTFEANIETLKDANGQPVSKSGYNPVTGDETATFKGRLVEFLDEGDAIKNFNDATNNQYFGLYWVPDKAYCINSNMQFGYKKYFDDDTNQWITKALVIVDGKVLDPKYIYLLKKSA